MVVVIRVTAASVRVYFPAHTQGFLVLYSSLTNTNNTVLRGEQAGVKYSAERHMRMWGAMADIDALIYTYEPQLGKFTRFY